MLWACIALPELALDAVLRLMPDPDHPLALVTGLAQSRRLHAVNRAAVDAGLRPGMRLAAAQALTGPALTGGLRLVEYDSSSEARWQAFLAGWAYRHSSLVSMQWPGAIVLEVRASFRLFGPWPTFERRLRAELTALGFTHRIALAPTPRAALVFAHLRDGFAVTHPAALRQALAQVPVRHALLPDDAGERLQRMGVRTLRAVCGLPHAGLRRRFGTQLLEHLDRLHGDVEDPLQRYAPPERFDQRIELGFEVESHQALLFPLRRLVGDLAMYLSIRDGGVQQFVLRLEHEGLRTDIRVGLLAAERDAGMLFEIARSRLERASIPKPVIALRLLAKQLPPFVPAARDLFDTRPAQAMPWPQLRERMRARLGDAAVTRIAIADDPRPEHAWRRAGIGDEAGCAAPAPPRPPRPTWLLQQPVPLRDHGLRIISGPERIESGWWDGADVRRDYYVLETSSGQHAWAFASPGQQYGWMLHGWFA